MDDEMKYLYLIVAISLLIALDLTLNDGGVLSWLGSLVGIS
jgi:hypothetical protein